MALAASEDAVQYSSDDSSSDLDVEESVLGGTSTGQGDKKDSWYKRLVAPKAKRGGYELSIQSGDIVRSPTPQSQVSSPPALPSPTAGKSPTSFSPRPPIEPPAATAGTSEDQMERAGGNPVLESETAAVLTPGPQGPSRPTKGGLYGMLFPVLRVVVQYYFYTVKVCRVDIPVSSILVLILNVFVLGVIGLAIGLTSYSPRINVSIKSFGIPDHPAQVHWDAYNAAASSKFWDNFTNTDLPYDAVRKRRSVDDESHTLFKRSDFSNCPVNSYTQARIHRNWEMDLVFRVPSQAAEKDDNILTVERIKYIHSVEESIYNSTGYQDVCRLRRGTEGAICYPLSSLLSWLYQRDPRTGKYVYNTSDGFTPDLPSSLRTISNLSVALWFTGGEATFNSDFTYVDAKLLRSEIRVGLPLKCFNAAEDRYDVQKQLVTNYFVSLMPVLEDLSTSDVEVLYGGPIIFDYQVTAAILHDAILAAISLKLVFWLMFFLSGFSLWLTSCGLYAINSCFIPAYLIYRGVFKIETIGLLNVISIFVVIGIGVDDVFVFVNTFKHSAKLPGLHDRYDRITHTILEATKATFFTSLTTSVAFLANVVSSIPAVRQFGIFMGLVVLFCFLQVFLVIPHVLCVWDCIFLKLENFFYYLPCTLLCRKKRRRSRYNALPDVGPVRMSNLAQGEGDEDDDSGINSVSSNSDNASNDSAQSEDIIGAGNDEDDDTNVLIVTERGNTAVVQVVPATVIAKDDTFERKVTSFMQKCMLYLSVAPMSLHLVFNYYRSRSPSWSGRVLLRIVHIVVSVKILLVVIAISLGLLSQLRFTNQPPQFFDPDSNIQKMLNLAGNVTDLGASECYDQCSSWSAGSDIPVSGGGGGGNGGGNGGGGNGGGQSTPRATPPTPRTDPVTRPSTPPRSTTRPTTQPSRSTTHATPPSTHRVTTPTSAPPTIPGGGELTKATVRPTDGTGTAPPTKEPTVNVVTSSKYSTNAPVYVVFGVKGVKRNYDPSHVLPEDGDEEYAHLDTSFSTLFTCNSNLALANPARVTGALRAMCRICANISNPANNLTLVGNYQCLPQSLQNSLSCLFPVISNIAECRALLLGADASKVSVSATANVTGSTYGKKSLFYLAMAFRSTSNPGASPFDSIHDYNYWNDFLQKELDDIMSKSSRGELYEGAQVLSTAFHTSEYWVEVNVQIVAVDGSLYGIVLSFVLCSIIVVVLAHDFRIVVSMVITIVTILLTLGGLFWCFSWKLGIVEAISLSILVGNSLDYCIHLSEGFVAVDTRHMAIVDKLPIAAKAPVRVKRVMAAISFIGVSIFSSAITTILAILPLVGTQIQLFARFGEILLLDTAVAIIYTLIICSNCLGFFGPPLTESMWKKVLNAVLTISLTFGFYIVVIICLAGISRSGVYVPSPQGGDLFG